MVNGVLGRLPGMRTGEASTVRIDMSIGRGKTHNLLARYHAAKGGSPARATSEEPQP
jgi:predicted AAA+ superfamily ATPase